MGTASVVASGWLPHNAFSTRRRSASLARLSTRRASVDDRLREPLQDGVAKNY
jgi:hypothetical protein